MSAAWLGVIGFAVVLTLMFVQVPVAVAMGVVGAVGFLWLQAGFHGELVWMSPDLNGVPQPALGLAQQMLLHLVAWVGMAFVLFRLALPSRRGGWGRRHIHLRHGSAFRNRKYSSR